MNAKVGRGLKYGAGLFLLILFLLPYVGNTSESRDLKYAIGTVEWILSLAIVCGISLVLTLFFKREINLNISEKWRRRLLWFMIPASLFLGELIGRYCFRLKPHLIDSIIQLWQAKLFSEGQVYGFYQGPISFFVSQHILFDDGKVYSQYAPGNSLFLLLNFFSYRNLAAWIAGLVTLICCFRFTRRIYSEQTALIATGLCGFSAFFLFNNQSFMNHVPALMFGALCMDLLSAWENKRSLWISFVIGLSAGAVFACRPLEGLFYAFFCVITVWVPLFRLERVGRFIQPLCFSAGFLLTAGLYFLYNLFTTGNAFLPGFIKLWGSGHALGFHESPWGEMHTPLRGLKAYYINLKLLNEYLFESALPPLSFLGLYLLIPWKARFTKWDKLLFFGTLGLPFLYVFYWHRDSFLGPRYTYVGLIFLYPLLAKVIHTFYLKAQGKRFLKLKEGGGYSLKNLFLFALVVTALYSLGFGIPYRAKLYAGGLRSMKYDLMKLPEVASMENAIIFVKVSWGTRIIATLRELGLSASMTEKIYRTTDHCDLWLLIKKAERGEINFEAGLKEFLSKPQSVRKVRMNGDPTLRLKDDDPGKLDPACIDEIEYDNLGFTIFEPHLLHNEVNFNGPFVVARDMRSANEKLKARYKEIDKYYLWQPGRLEKLQ